MKNSNFELDLLNKNIVDNRNLYIIVAKKRTLFPSLKVLVMGLNKDKLVIYRINTRYVIKEYIEEINVKDISLFDIDKKRVDTVLNIYLKHSFKSYFILENNKEAYNIKKFIKK